MMLTIFAENGRGRHLCRLALARGFQVNMVASNQETIQELPFGEWIKDKDTDWAQDFFSEGKNIIQDNDLCEFGRFGRQPLSLASKQTLHSTVFDWDEANSTKTEGFPPLFQRQWGLVEWQDQLKKLTHLGLELNGDVNSVSQEVVIDFRSDLRTKPLWQWAVFTLQWDLDLYQDVMPSQFLWLSTPEEYLAYENFSYVQKTEDQWKVFVKLPYQTEPSTEGAQAVMTAWLKNFKKRWAWARAEWTGQWQLLPFYQWKKELQQESSARFYDMGPKFLGSYSFEKQWKLENKIFNVLTASMNQRKKSGYDFKIHAS